jgi:hypothetical protein
VLSNIHIRIRGARGLDRLKGTVTVGGKRFLAPIVKDRHVPPI